jgi:hypothetical protein
MLLLLAPRREPTIDYSNGCRRSAADPVSSSSLRSETREPAFFSTKPSRPSIFACVAGDSAFDRDALSPRPIYEVTHRGASPPPHGVTRASCSRRVRDITCFLLPAFFPTFNGSTRHRNPHIRQSPLLQRDEWGGLHAARATGSSNVAMEGVLKHLDLK